MRGKRINTTAKGNRYENILAKWLRSRSWKVEKARVSRGLFDLVAIRERRLFIQVKTNGYPSRDYWEPTEDAYQSLPEERVWATPWTHSRTGVWSVWYLKNGEKVREDFKL